jgi:hypothetical protein
MAPLFEKYLAQTRAYVQTTLPFRTSDRVAELEKLEGQYRSGLLSAPKAVGRLWAFMEDEFRLTRENGVYQQTIIVDGEPQLAEVVRIGMVMLYFRVGEDTVGRAVQKDGTWSYETFKSSEEEKAVISLFQSFKKQIRAGYFEIPNALPGVTEGDVVLPASVTSAVPEVTKPEPEEAIEGDAPDAANADAANADAAKDAADKGATDQKAAPATDAATPVGGAK